MPFNPFLFGLGLFDLGLGLLFPIEASLDFLGDSMFPAMSLLLVLTRFMMNDWLLYVLNEDYVPSRADHLLVEAISSFIPRKCQ